METQEIKFHAVMIDETGCEFGVGVRANSRSEAYDILREDYPESRVDQLETEEESAERERMIVVSSYFDDQDYDDYDY